MPLAILPRVCSSAAGGEGGVFPKQVFLLPYLSSLSQEVRQAHAARGRWGGDCKSTHEALVSSLPLPPPCCCHGNARSHRLTFPVFFFRQQLPPFALISPPIHGEQPPAPLLFFFIVFKKKNSVDFLPCMSTWECEAGLGASASSTFHLGRWGEGGAGARLC